MRRLVWTSAARADIDGILEYYEHLDPRVGLFSLTVSKAPQKASGATTREGRAALPERVRRALRRLGMFWFMKSMPTK